MKGLHAVVAVACLIFLSSLVLTPFGNADWAMFRSDVSHSGAASGNQVPTPVLLWNYTTGDYVDSSPAVVGGVVYVGSDDGNVYALSASDGSKLWNYSAGYYNYVDSSPAVVGGVVYVGSDDGNVYALKAASGAKLWNYTVGTAVDSSPAVVNGVVYIGSEVSTLSFSSSTGEVYALNTLLAPNSGAILQAVGYFLLLLLLAVWFTLALVMETCML